MTILDQHPEGIRRAGDMSDHDILKRAKKLIEIYIAFLGKARIGRDVLDVVELPSARDTLINAFRLVIAAENRITVREQLLKIGLTLAQFQDDIGPRMSLQPVARDAVSAEGQILEAMRENHFYLARFDKAFGAIAPERTRLAELFRKSMDIAAIRNARHPDLSQASAGSAAYH